MLTVKYVGFCLECMSHEEAHPAYEISNADQREIELFRMGQHRGYGSRVRPCVGEGTVPWSLIIKTLAHGERKPHFRIIR